MADTRRAVKRLSKAESLYRESTVEANIAPTATPEMVIIGTSLDKKASKKALPLPPGHSKRMSESVANEMIGVPPPPILEKSASSSSMMRRNSKGMSKAKRLSVASREILEAETMGIPPPPAPLDDSPNIPPPPSTAPLSRFSIKKGATSDGAAGLSLNNLSADKLSLLPKTNTDRKSMSMNSASLSDLVKHLVSDLSTTPFQTAFLTFLPVFTKPSVFLEELKLLFTGAKSVNDLEATKKDLKITQSKILEILEAFKTRFSDC